MFRLSSTWVLPAPPDRVWDVIADVERWPQWWPGMERATVVRHAPDAVGERVHLVVRSPLGYALRFGVEITDASPPARALARVVGGLVGTGEWAVAPTAEGSEARITWHVMPAHQPLRALSRPLAGPLAWAHGRVMAGGETALHARLTSS